MKPGVEWIILLTENYEKSRDFYQNTLQFTLEREVADDEFCQFVLPFGHLAIFSRKNLVNMLGEQHVKTGGGAVYSFPESTDIDADYETLKARGVQFIKEPTTQPWNQRTAYFTDPDGHIWELQQWLKKD